MRPVRLVARLAVPLSALANCGTSPTTHDFTLDQEPRASSDEVLVDWPVTVAAVHLPPSLDRSTRRARNWAGVMSQGASVSCEVSRS